PDYGSETLEEAKKKIEEIKKLYNAGHFGIHDIESIRKKLNGLSLFPATRHGIEQALILKLAKEKNTALSKLLGLKSRNKVNVNSLIGITGVTDAARKAREYAASGYKSIKLKCGRKDFSEDLKVIAAVRKAVGKNVALRLDLNSKWTVDEAASNLEELVRFNPEYIEQPVSGKENLAKLSALTDLPLAADESIRTIQDARYLIEHKACSALILKPMLLGGILNTLDIISEADKHGIKTVISSSFESPVGLNAALFIASTVKEDISHGLGTGELFSNSGFPIVQDGGIIFNEYTLLV
ncbi:MAG: o-succinylbenzoate synthase, partial [Ignavibacteriota bacterium]